MPAGGGVGIGGPKVISIPSMSTPNTIFLKDLNVNGHGRLVTIQNENSVSKIGHVRVNHRAPLNIWGV